jgi:hypothetical protein
MCIPGSYRDADVQMCGFLNDFIKMFIMLTELVEQRPNKLSTFVSCFPSRKAPKS